MGETRKKPSLESQDSVLTTKSDACPHVSDLIDFAIGRLSPELEPQVRQHLLAENCSSCRSWVDQTGRHRGEPPIDWANWATGSTMTKPTPASVSPHPSPSDPTPVPENAKWQRTAFRELERRLGMPDNR